jgi:hypothetical protein
MTSNMRFCMAMDVTVVGGLPRLISAFLRDVSSGGRGGVDGSGRLCDNIDIVTSIDRDFGGVDAWPSFVSVEVMDPVPMFVGDIDGIRRHAIGGGFHPVFDAGVGHLILLVPGGEGGAEKEGETGGGLTPSELWNASTPRYAKDHCSTIIHRMGVSPPVMLIVVVVSSPPPPSC